VLDAGGKVQYKQPTNGGGTKIVGTCGESRDCTKMKNYVSIPKFLREAQGWLGHTRGIELKGVY
jgi:hypothetical protein